MLSRMTIAEDPARNGSPPIRTGIPQQPLSGLHNPVRVRPDDLRYAGLNRLEPLAGAAGDQYGDTQYGGLLLDSPAIGDDELRVHHEPQKPEIRERGCQPNIRHR